MLSPRRKLPRARSVASRDRGVVVGTSGYELGASPRLGARRRSALAVLQEQPETDARVSNDQSSNGEDGHGGGASSVADCSAARRGERVEDGATVV